MHPRLPMLTIFHAPYTRSVRVIWMAEEMGLTYELTQERIGAPSEAFLAANPARALPAVIDGETVMTESIAILQYLAARHGPTPLAPEPDDPAYADYLQFLIYGEASLAAYLNPLVATKFMAPPDEKVNFTAGMCESMFKRRLALLDRRLERWVNVAGPAFTAADISVTYGLDLGGRLGLAESYSPRIADYAERMRARPGYQAAVSK